VEVEDCGTEARVLRLGAILVKWSSRCDWDGLSGMGGCPQALLPISTEVVEGRTFDQIANLIQRNFLWVDYSRQIHSEEVLVETYDVRWHMTDQD
jgi:hypothetical protein